MIADRLDRESDAAAQRYLLLVGTWNGLYQNAFFSGDLTSPPAINDLRDQALAVGGFYMTAEQDAISERLHSIAVDAQGATLDAIAAPVVDKLAEQPSEHVVALSEYLDSELSVQISRDVEFMRRQLRNTALAIRMAAQAQGISTKAAAIQHRAHNAAELKFQFKDRAGRKWPSHKFVRSAWRQSLLQTHNDTVLLTLADHGLTEAEIQRPSASPERISLLPGSSLPVYAEIRDEVFHPNSEAVLAAVTQN